MSLTRADDRADSSTVESTEGQHLAQPPHGDSHARAGTAAVRRILETGQASYYGTSTMAERAFANRGDGFIGRTQANGKPLDPHAMTVAHKTLTMGTQLTVHSLETGKTVDVTVTDRGPYVPGRIIDGTVAVAEKLGYRDVGHAKVEIYKK